jgi:hypothetical protein
MANPNKGEIAFDVEGESYKLSFSANTFCELEEALGKDTEAIVEEITSGKNVKLAALRIVFWKALEDHHEGITLDDTKRLLKHVMPVEMGTLLGKALVASMPPVEESNGDASVPPKPGGQSGTGPASTKRGPRLAATRIPSGAEPRANST